MMVRGCGAAFVTASVAPWVGRRNSLPLTRRPLRRARVPRATIARDRPELQDVSEPVIRAVERLGGGARVTVPDVAAAAGLALNAAEREVVLLASLTGAAIDVTDAGDVAYRFARDVRGRLRAASFRSAARMAWDRAYPVLFTGVRIGFGALLIISIIVTFVAIVALSSAANSNDDDRRSRGPGDGFAMRMFTPNIFDILFYTRAQRQYDYYNSGYGNVQVEKPQMSFLEAVYSFVFGDGNPNVDVEERQWKAIAAVINANSGAVTAEQLRPFLVSPAAGASGNIPYESDILPVLTRFSGHPEVTSDGDIIYVFPEFSTTGGGGRRVEFAGAAATYLSEKEEKFSAASASQKVYAFGLGLVNVVGAVTLGGMLANARALTADSAALLGFVKAIYPAIAVYALTFVLVPAVRLLWQRWRNRDVRARNQTRMRAAARLAAPTLDVRRKIDAAARFKFEKRVVATRDVVYSTDMDADEVEQRRQQQLAEDFDRKMGGR